MLSALDAPFQTLGASLGIAPDNLKILFLFFISYPLAALIKRIPNEQAKHVYIISVSGLYLSFLGLWSGVRTLFLSSSVSYLLAKYGSGPLMPWTAFFFLMAHMSVNHLHRQKLNDPDTVDISGAQMVLLMKLSTFCWNVYDGQLLKTKTGSLDKDHEQLRKKQAIKELPSLLEFASFALFFPSLLAGPNFVYNEYKSFIDTSMFPRPHRKGKRRLGRIDMPSTFFPAMEKMAIAIVYLLAHMKLSGSYSPSILTQDSFLLRRFPSRLFVLYMAGLTARLKYYAVWTLTEGSCIMSGFGFVNSKHGISWNRLENVNPKALETATNFRTCINSWNINTSTWLRNCIYIRVVPENKKAGVGALVASFMASAVWHGFYPGYYLSFLLGAFYQIVDHEVHRLANPRRPEKPGGKLVDPRVSIVPARYQKTFNLVMWFSAQISLSFLVAPFLLLELAPSLEVWRRMYFFGIVFTAFSVVFIRSPLLKKARKASVKRAIKIHGYAPAPSSKERSKEPTDPAGESSGRAHLPVSG